MPASTSLQIAERVARLLPSGSVVNLGIGIPTLVADVLSESAGVVVHTENGMLGVGPAPPSDKVEPTLVNAGKLPVSELPGAAYFSSAESFGMIRGGHVDVAVLGVLEVDGRGRIANWSLPGRPILGVGGAMDLLVGARRVIAATMHLTRDGDPKIVTQCRFPLTGERQADVIVTEHATFELERDELVLCELEPTTTLEWIREHTGAPFRVSPDLAAQL